MLLQRAARSAARIRPLCAPTALRARAFSEGLDLDFDTKVFDKQPYTVRSLQPAAPCLGRARLAPRRRPLRPHGRGLRSGSN